MNIIPAIDIKGGKCVRLFQGDYNKETIYSDDPVSVAKKWEAEGADFLHLVDLDGALEGELTNFEIIKSIIKSVNMHTDIGGGIRDIESIKRYLDAGVDKVVLGTIAHSKPEFVTEVCQKHPGKIIVGIDASKGKVAVRGWKDVTEQDALEMAKKMEGQGVAAIIYTDISRDGTLTGPNIEAIRFIAESIDIPVIASGGVAKLSDIEDLAELEQFGVSGIILGKALYSGNITIKEALKVLNL